MAMETPLLIMLYYNFSIVEMGRKYKCFVIFGMLYDIF